MEIHPRLFYYVLLMVPPHPTIHCCWTLGHGGPSQLKAQLASTDIAGDQPGSVLLVVVNVFLVIVEVILPRSLSSSADFGWPRLYMFKLKSVDVTLILH